MYKKCKKPKKTKRPKKPKKTKKNKKNKQAGAELCQAQAQLRLRFRS